MKWCNICNCNEKVKWLREIVLIDMFFPSWCRSWEVEYWDHADNYEKQQTIKSNSLLNQSHSRPWYLVESWYQWWYMWQLSTLKMSSWLCLLDCFWSRVIEYYQSDDIILFLRQGAYFGWENSSNESQPIVYDKCWQGNTFLQYIHQDISLRHHLWAEIGNQCSTSIQKNTMICFMR